jgi:hypothetical protein
MKTKTTLLLTFAVLSASLAKAQCTIQEQTVTGTNVVCSGSGKVNLASSETGVNYYLRRDSDNSIVSGPVEGTGSAIFLNTGIVTLPTVFNVNAKTFSKSLDFETDVDNFVSLGTSMNSVFTGNNQITVEAWINLESYSNLPTIIGNYTGGMQFLLRIDSQKPSFWISNGSFQNVLGTTVIPLNTWVHLAGTWDGTTMKVYYNGILEGSTLASGTFPSVSNEVRIGASRTDESFDGKLDNVRVWNVAKSGVEINNNKSICLVGNETNLVAYYDFENIVGATLEDLTSNNYDGTLINSPLVSSGTDFCTACVLQMATKATISISPLTQQTFSPLSSSVVCSGIAAVNLTGSDAGASYYLRNNANNAIVAGPFIGTGGPLTLSTNVTSTSTFNIYAEKSGLLGTGTALSFDGSNDFVDVSGVTTNLANNDFTIEAWINTTGINEGIVTKSDPSGWQPGEKCFYIDGQGRPSFVGWGNDFILGAAVVNDGTWHHIAVTWNYSTSTGKMYADGVECTTYDNYQPNQWDNIGNTVKIGAPNYAEAPNYFSGMMDEIRIWNTTRTASQISNYSSSCLFGKEPGLLAYYPFENETGVTATDLTGGIENGTLMNFAATPYVTGLGCGASCSTTMSTLYTANVNPLADLALTMGSSSVICNGNTDITTSNSEQGVSYYLRNNANDTIISGPLTGNGSPLTFNTGNVSSTTTYNVYATKSSALDFDGTNDYIESPVVGITGVFTFETWIKTNDPTPEWSGIITTKTTSGTGMFTQFSLADNGTLRWESNSPNLYIPNMSTVINNNVWHHVAVVSDGSSLTFYVDGNVEYSTAFVAGSINRNLLFMSEREMNGFIPGKMDDARIWNVARTRSQIQSSMNTCLTGSEPGLMIYYNFENNAGSSVVTDLAGGDQNGTLNNMDPMTDYVDGMVSCSCTREMTVTPTLTVNSISNQTVTAAQSSLCDNGTTTINLASSETTVNYYLRNDLNDSIVAGPLVGTGNALSLSTGNVTATTTYNVYAERPSANMALALDGSGKYVSVSNINIANQSFTIEFWAKRNASGADFLMGQGNNGSTNQSLHIGFRNNNTFTFAFYGNDIDVTSPTDMNYHHYSCVYNAAQSGNDRFVYIDGVLAGSDDASADFQGTGEFRIGDHMFNSDYFNGNLDEVKIWNKALTQTEVQSGMTYCISGTENGLIAYYNMNSPAGTLIDNSGNGNTGILVNINPLSDFTVAAAPIICSICSLEMTPTATVTIKHSTTSTDVKSACDNYTWIDGLTYTSDNNTATYVLPNAAGCDSTVTLNLTIKNSTTGTDVQSACDSYTWIDGLTYTSSNNAATHVLTNAAGCDSTVTLNLTIKNSSASTDAQTACRSFTWIDGLTYTSSNNTATMLFTNAAGCDSTVTLDLTINTVDVSTTVNGVLITANANGASYLWLDCDNQTTIAGEIGQSFTAIANGNYAAIVTENSCTDTSACVNISTVGLTEVASNNNLILSPNPTSGYVSITQTGTFNNTIVRLMTIDGKASVIEGNFTGNKCSFDMSDYAAGIYFIEVSQKDKVTRMKVVKN